MDLVDHLDVSENTTTTTTVLWSEPFPFGIERNGIDYFLMRALTPSRVYRWNL